MAFDVYVFLLVVFLLLCVALLGRLCWFQLQPSHSPGGAIRSATQRLLKPRTPLDCPACRLSHDMRNEFTEMFQPVLKVAR